MQLHHNVLTNSIQKRIASSLWQVGFKMSPRSEEATMVLHGV